MIHVPTTLWAHGLFEAVGWAAGGALGFAVSRWRLKAATAHLGQAVGGGYFAALVVGAVPGAWLAGSLNTMSGMHPALSHSIVGALAGAILAVEIYKAVRGIRGSTGAVFVPAFALGAVIGRWGCLFAGLPDYTYGAPTRLPWAVDLGDGVGRHPVQVYESLSMAAFLVVWLLAVRTRAPWAVRRGFYALCAWYGAQRFAWEFLKPYAHVLGPLNLFHLICGGLIAYGVVFWVRDLADERAGRSVDAPLGPAVA